MKRFIEGEDRSQVSLLPECLDDFMDTADRTLPEDWLVKGVRLNAKIDELRQKLKDLRSVRKKVRAAPDGQISLTDPDARAMTTHSNTGTVMVGYNVQAAVDVKHHLVVAHEVTNRPRQSPA